MDTDYPERRKHQRHKADGSLIIYNDKMYAEVMDISLGGLACRSRINPGKIFFPNFDVEILDTSSGKFLKDISGILVRYNEHPPAVDNAKEIVLDFAIEFSHMTGKKIQLLDAFMKSSLESPAYDVTFN